MTRNKMRIFLVIISIMVIGFIFFSKIKDTHIPNYYEIIKDKKNIPIIKVQSIVGITGVDISLDGLFVLLDKQDNTIRQGKNGAKHLQIKYSKEDSGFVVILPNFVDKLKNDVVKIQSLEGNPIHINDRYYVGTVKLVIAKDETFDLINELDLETYLLGVLLGETSDTFSLEAIKAQAITSRTFALSEMENRQNKPWHVRGGITAQVFMGMASISKKLQDAVLETRGVVLLDRGKIFRAYFFSSCGGATADLTSLPWEKDQASVMQARECIYCKKVKPNNFEWSVKYTEEQLLEVFRKAGYNFNNITAIENSLQDKYGRVLTINVFDQNQKTEINALRFRVDILKDSSKLRSCLFKISLQNGAFVFTGSGWGHGVGLCQYGSQGLAKEGRNCYDILKYYYTGVQFAKYYE